MYGDYFEFWFVVEGGGGFFGDVFVVGAVKAVSSDAVFAVEVLRERV